MRKSKVNSGIKLGKFHFILVSLSISSFLFEEGKSSLVISTETAAVLGLSIQSTPLRPAPLRTTTSQDNKAKKNIKRCC